MRAFLALLLAAYLSVGCYGNTTPGPTPGNMDDVIANIVLQGVTVKHLTSGDAGCETTTLHDNAVHATVVIGDQSLSHEVYVLNWRNQAKFDAAAADFAACLDEIRANPGSVVTEVEAYPWRAYGPGWTPQLRTIIENALRSSGGGSAP